MVYQIEQDNSGKGKLGAALNSNPTTGIMHEDQSSMRAISISNGPNALNSIEMSSQRMDDGTNKLSDQLDDIFNSLVVEHAVI